MAHATKVLAVAVISILALGACGGSSSAKSNPAADLAAAKSAVLTKADLPDYDNSPHKNSDDPPDSVKTAFRQCTKAEVTPLDEGVDQQKADSDDFDKDNTSIENTVVIAAKKSDIDKRWKALTASNVTTCLEDLFREAVKASAPSDDPSSKLDAIHVDKLSVNKIGDRALAFRAKASVTTSEGSGDAYLDILFAQKARGVGQLFVTQGGSPFDSATETSLLQKVVDRMPKS